MKISEKNSQGKKIDMNTLKFILAKPVFLNIILVLVQFIVFFAIWFFFADYLRLFFIFSYVLSFFLIVLIVNEDSNVAYKISWLVPLAAFPILGAALFIILNIIPATKKISEKLLLEQKNALKFMRDDMVNSKKNIEDFMVIDKSYARLANFLHKKVYYPTYANTSLRYFSQGLYMFESMKEDMRRAEKYIFIEFFVVSTGRLMNEILEILQERIENGVEVYLIYDGTNEFSLPDGYEKFLAEMGIKVKVYAPFKPIISTYQNNRDHRKIVVMDGKIGYTGGVNLADEYVGYITRFGHWKDTGVRLDGDAVNSMVEMFLSMWNLSERNQEKRLDYGLYLKSGRKAEEKAAKFVTPFADSPNDSEKVSENIILHMLYDAKESVLISSPYFIIDNELYYAISYAAKRGIDVKIIIPGIPDKKIPYLVAKSHFPSLLNSGVKLYTYTGGFNHSKMYLVDGKVSMIGTVNLDYRSLYLHFENGVLVYDEDFSKKMGEDFEDIINSSSKVTMEDYNAIPLITRFLSRILRIFGPLM